MKQYIAAISVYNHKNSTKCFCEYSFSDLRHEIHEHLQKYLSKSEISEIMIKFQDVGKISSDKCEIDTMTVSVLTIRDR